MKTIHARKLKFGVKSIFAILYKSIKFEEGQTPRTPFSGILDKQYLH